jgi:hypothetical protein
VDSWPTPGGGEENHRGPGATDTTAMSRLFVVTKARMALNDDVAGGTIS